MKWAPHEDELRRRWPLPVAQLSLRARNSKTPLERHQAACYLWEASLKLLGSTLRAESVLVGGAVDVGGAESGLPGRPSLGQWWEEARRLLVLLSEEGPHPQRFRPARDFLLGSARNDLPLATGLDALLREILDGEVGARSTMRLCDLFDDLVRYRNQAFSGRRRDSLRGAPRHRGDVPEHRGGEARGENRALRHVYRKRHQGG